MLDCTEEALHALNICGPFSIVGHSMGGLCALAYTLTHPERLKKLVLIGSISGGPAIARGKGMPWGMQLTDLDFWQFVSWGLQLSSGFGSLAVHKKLLRLLWKYSYADKSLIPRLEIIPDDYHSPAPMRDKWPKIARKLDYSRRLKEICVPALICVGRFDPQAPVSCSEELAQSIPEARLVIFEQSGHYPFVEERQQFMQVFSDFLTT